MQTATGGWWIHISGKPRIDSGYGDKNPFHNVTGYVIQLSDAYLYLGMCF
jgi:hypothetical protein